MESELSTGINFHDKTECIIQINTLLINVLINVNLQIIIILYYALCYIDIL